MSNFGLRPSRRASQTPAYGDWKDSVKAITAASIAAYTRNGNTITGNANGALGAINGITLAAGDSFYLKNGAAGADNGFWKVQQLGTGSLPFILVRRDDADTSAKLTPRFRFAVEQGSQAGDWYNTNTSITLNTTSITVAAFPGGLILTDDAGDIKQANSDGSVALGASSEAAPADHVHPDNCPLQKSSTTIATAAVKTLNATPVSVIPAPGSGKYIEVVSIHARLVYGTAGYDAVGSGDDLSFKYTNASGAKVVTDIEATGFGDATSDQNRITYPTNAAANLTPVANAAVVAHILSGEWFSAAGDSALHIEALYRIRTLAI